MWLTSVKTNETVPGFYTIFGFPCKNPDQYRLWITGKRQVKERKSINLDSISVCGILGFRLFPGISNMPLAPNKYANNVNDYVGSR